SARRARGDARRGDSPARRTRTEKRPRVLLPARHGAGAGARVLDDFGCTMIHFDCECGKSLNAPPDLAGTVGCCPVCGIYVAVPHPPGDGSSEFENADVYAVSIEPPSENDPREQPAFVPTATPRAPFQRGALDAWAES